MDAKKEEREAFEAWWAEYGKNLQGGWINVIACEWHPIEFTNYSASAIETAAIMKCAEVVDGWASTASEYGFDGDMEQFMRVKSDLLALIPQDGRTALEDICKQARKEALLEAAKHIDSIQGQEIHDTMTYKLCASELRRMAEGEKK